MKKLITFLLIGFAFFKGVLTPNDLRPLNWIFSKHGGDLQIEFTAKNERTGFGDELN